MQYEITTSRRCSASGKGDNKGGWLDPPGKCAYARRRRHPSRQDGRRLTRDNQGNPTCARGWSRRNTRHMQGQTCTRRRRRWRRSKLCCLRSRRANVEERLWPWWTCEGRISALQHEEECSPNCRQKITRQVKNTCSGCCITACTARATPHKIRMKSLHRHSAISS